MKTPSFKNGSHDSPCCLSGTPSARLRLREKWRDGLDTLTPPLRSRDMTIII
ncbi:hypothetical protein IM543_13505 [Massilia sp. UMI-21]|nr:hypothetical protein IM543_13505 [Massilia sp. UMI-21]